MGEAEMEVEMEAAMKLRSESPSGNFVRVDRFGPASSYAYGSYVRHHAPLEQKAGEKAGVMAEDMAENKMAEKKPGYVKYYPGYSKYYGYYPYSRYYGYYPTGRYGYYPADRYGYYPGHRYGYGYSFYG